MSKILGAALLAAALAVAAYGQAPIPEDRIVGCYLGTWANYRLYDADFKIEDIDPFLCTHAFYGFADLSNETWKVKSWDPWLDLSSEDCDELPDCCGLDAFRRFTGLKNLNPNFHPMISVGGWTAGSRNFSPMAADPAKRKTFIDSVIELCLQFGFDGADLDWEYPAFFEGSSTADRENFALLVTEMGAALRAQNLIFSGAVNVGFDKVEEAYDIDAVMEGFDFVNLMSYDFHGYWDDGRWDHRNFTGHNSPLITRKEENDPNHPGYKYNQYDGVDLWLSLGGKPEKMVLGIASYGRGFMLADPQYDGAFCPAKGPLPAGKFTNQSAFWGYNEIAKYQRDAVLPDFLPEAEPLQWKITRDACYQGPFMSNGPYWIGYDDPESALIKSKYANAMGLRGAFVWSLDTCDFNGEYNDDGATYPILRAMWEGLDSGETYMPDRDCVGTAANCDPNLPPDTLPELCTEDGEFLPHPSSCHWYFRCEEVSEGEFEVQYFDCGDDFYDPIGQSCVYDPVLCPPDGGDNPGETPGPGEGGGPDPRRRSEDIAPECIGYEPLA